MKTEIDVKTTVTVDLGDFPLRDLIDEIEDRGHMVDNSDLDSAHVHELLEELQRLNYKEFADLDFAELIKAFEYMGCPPEIIKGLKEWNNQPVPTLRKLEVWKALSCEG